MDFFCVIVQAAARILDETLPALPELLEKPFEPTLSGAAGAPRTHPGRLWSQ